MRDFLKDYLQYNIFKIHSAIFIDCISEIMPRFTRDENKRKHIHFTSVFKYLHAYKST